MTTSLNEDVVQRVNDLGPTPWSGTTYRYTSNGRDPLSGEGARRFGGRWNPREAFPAVYLAQPVATCLAELGRTSSAGGISPQSRLRAGVTLHTIEAANLRVLDLTDPSAQDQVGLDADDIADEDHTACQMVGHAAHFLGYQGVLAPSATGAGLVITAFEVRLHPGQLTLSDSHALTQQVYEQLR